MACSAFSPKSTSSFSFCLLGTRRPSGYTDWLTSHLGNSVTYIEGKSRLEGLTAAALVAAMSLLGELGSLWYPK